MEEEFFFFHCDFLEVPNPTTDNSAYRSMLGIYLDDTAVFYANFLRTIESNKRWDTKLRTSGSSLIDVCFYVQLIFPPKGK